MDVKQFSADKILGHIDRIGQWLETGFSRPVTFELDMTNICNHSCPWCFGYYERLNSKASLTLKEAKDIIRQIRDFGGRGLTFTGGGEPLCNPYTIKALEYARGKGLDVGFITNGMLLNKENAVTILKNCSWIRVSLDAATSDMFRFSHGSGKSAFERVVGNIRLLVSQKKRLNSPCTVGVGYLTSPETRREMYRFALLCRKLKVDYAQFRPLLHGFNRRKHPAADAADRGIAGEIEKSLGLSGPDYQVLYSKHKYDSMAGKELIRPYKVCYGHHFAAVVAADKKMYVCCHYRGVKEYCVGDLGRKTLKEIWRSKEREMACSRINLNQCVALCRCNTFNTVLWNIKQEKTHPNFI